VFDLVSDRRMELLVAHQAEEDAAKELSSRGMTLKPHQLRSIYRFGHAIGINEHSHVSVASERKTHCFAYAFRRTEELRHRERWAEFGKGRGGTGVRVKGAYFEDWQAAGRSEAGPVH
jgi:hypothetical protein